MIYHLVFKYSVTLNDVTNSQQYEQSFILDLTDHRLNNRNVFM